MKDRLPKISVVIPSYNKASFIEQTLKSIFDQKYPNLQVFVQDGGSDDGTLEIVDRYAKKFPKTLSWESKPDGGQLNAVVKGLQKATGDILTFINADDCYVSDTFTTIVRSYNMEKNAVWFVGQGVVVDKNGKEIAKPITFYKNLMLRFWCYPLLQITNFIIQPSVFVTRFAYKKYGPFIGTKDFITEYDLWLKLAKENRPCVIRKTLSRFRMGDSTITSTMFRELLRQDERVVKKTTTNLLILFLHQIHNWGRLVVHKFI